MNANDELNATIHDLVQDGRGILATDESVPTISKRFKTVGIEFTEESRRAYRELLLTTPGIGEFISGIILFEETLGQKTADGTLFSEAAKRVGIVPGIKVNKGPIALVNAPCDTEVGKPAGDFRWRNGAHLRVIARASVPMPREA